LSVQYVGLQKVMKYSTEKDKLGSVEIDINELIL